MMITNLTERGDVGTSMVKGGPGWETVMLENPLEEFDFIGDFSLLNLIETIIVRDSSPFIFGDMRIGTLTGERPIVI